MDADWVFISISSLAIGGLLVAIFMMVRKPAKETIHLNNAMDSNATPAPPAPQSDFFAPKHRETLSITAMDKVKAQVYHNNRYEFVKTEIRNCLLCGRTRSGKTTTMGVLMDPCYSPKSSSIFSETQNPTFHSFAINNRAATEVQKFTIHIVDTPGLFEVKSKEHKDEKRTNEVLAETIAKCLENEITVIHCIILFLTFEAGVNRDDIDAMKLFLDMFGGSGVSVALCVTHADKHTDDWKEDIKKQLTQHEELSVLIDREKMPIVFMGCVNTKDKHYREDTELLEDYKSIYNMRESMLQLIFLASQKRLLTETNLAKKQIAAVDAKMTQVIESFKLFLEIADDTSLQTSSLQEGIIRHRLNIQFLTDNSPYLNVPELQAKFVQIVSLAKKLLEKPMADLELRTSLIWPDRKSVV